MWLHTINDPPLPPILRKMPGRHRKLRIKHVTERVNAVTRSGRMMTCTNCCEKGHNKKTCKKEPQPKPVKEKRKQGRKKPGSSFVFPTDVIGKKDEGTSGAGPSSSVPSNLDPDGAGQNDAGPSVQDQTTYDDTGFMHEVRYVDQVTEDPVEDSQDHETPTQQSCTNKPVAKKSGAKTAGAKKTGAKKAVAKRTGAQMVKEGIAAGVLKTASLKRRCKSERIGKKPNHSTLAQMVQDPVLAKLGMLMMCL
ncbi:hypothetical protein CTI12_AA189580 [Artemisia annua]|uniref:CCHC-type domain-containing protein n=1 Tax=Artemisia annua TaxID=35608 RepID=A0A2U1P5Z5_ARTAN|nr:hypothetical protein CTI12_AA189580 [Artemisia annua]